MAPSGMSEVSLIPSSVYSTLSEALARTEPLSNNFGDFFDTNIKEAYRSMLLDPFNLIYHQPQNNLAKIQPGSVKLACEEN